MILPIEYNDVYISSTSIYWNKDNVSGVSNLEGKEKLRIENSKYINPFGEGLVISENNEKYRSVYNTDGKVIIEGIHPDGIYTDVHELQDGLMAACKNGKWGYISESGEEKIPFIYDEAITFTNGYARIKQGDNYGIINTNGDIVIKPKYSDIKYTIKDGVENKEGTGLIGNYVVDDRVVVKEGKVEYIVDLSGKRVSDYYKTIEYVGNEIVATMYSEKSTRRDGISVMLINKDSEKRTKEYAMMGYMPYDLRIVNEEESEEGYIINAKGEVVNSNLYGAFTMPYSEGYDSFVTKKGSGWAVISSAGKELIEFDDKVKVVTIYDNDLYYLEYKDGNVDLVNETGTSILK